MYEISFIICLIDKYLLYHLIFRNFILGKIILCDFDECIHIDLIVSKKKYYLQKCCSRNKIVNKKLGHIFYGH